MWTATADATGGCSVSAAGLRVSWLVVYSGDWAAACSLFRRHAFAPLASGCSCWSPSNIIAHPHLPALLASPTGDPGFLFVEEQEGQHIGAITTKQQLDEVGFGAL